MSMPFPQRGPRLSSSLELVATILTIVTCVWVCGLLALDLAERKDRRAGTSGAVIPIGSILTPTPGVSYNESQWTVLVGLSSRCRFCGESMPALRKLNEFIASSDATRVRALALSLESSDVLSRYLKENNLTTFRTVSVARQSEVARIAARTPTLVLADRTGKVLAAWSGRMTADQMELVLKRLIPTTDVRR